MEGVTGTASPGQDGLQLRAAPLAGHDVAVYSFGFQLPERPRVLALKLDHLDDFIIGLPSLRKLRTEFPDAHIHLVVGSWNRAAALDSGLADQVSTYDFFPQNAFGWDGEPSEPIERFWALMAGPYDLAIDLRVDDDTRFLLGEVDATLRCGIGVRTRFPFLDVVLPPQHESRSVPSTFKAGEIVFGADRFESRMPVQHTFSHETDFRPIVDHAIFGPYAALPLGSFRAIFAIQMFGVPVGLRDAEVTVDVAQGGRIVALEQLKAAELRKLPAAGIGLTFENQDFM